MSSLTVGISAPADFFDWDHEQRQRYLTQVADAGLDHVFIADHVSFRGGSGIDAVTYLAAMSGIEPRLGLYAGVLLLSLRHPMVAARQINQLALAAPGRVSIGIGVGGEDRHEFEVCGVDPATRGRRTDAAMDIVRRLLTGDVVDHDDEFFQLADARILPAIDPPVPFVVGGRSDAAARRAGRLGDGWLASWCSAKRFAVGVARAEEAAAEVGRRPHWQHGLQIWLGADDDPARARELVAEGMESFYRIPFDAFEKYTPAGPPELLAEYLSPYVEAGARVLNLTPRGPSPEVEVEVLAEVRRLLRA